MERKKTTKKSTSVNTKQNTKKQTKKVLKKNVLKKKKGFTLIELLAVIIILGILMIVAIPSVTKYISDSRKSAYVDTAKEIVSGTRNLVNEGKLGMYDTGTTYYIPAKYVNTENSLKSPYGEFTDESAYVGVIYDGQGYKYYWISCDDSGQGIPDITLADKLESDDIQSDLKIDDIKTKIENTGIGERKTIKILKTTGTWETPIILSNTDNNVPEGSGSGQSSTTISSCPNCVYAFTENHYPIYPSWNNEGAPATKMTDSSTYYTNYNDLLSVTHTNTFLGLVLDNSTKAVNDIYVCFVIKDNSNKDIPLCLRPSEGNTYYNSNKNIIDSVSSLWTNGCNETSFYYTAGNYDIHTYRCSSDTMTVFIEDIGTVNAEGIGRCSFNSFTGSSGSCINAACQNDFDCANPIG